MSQRLRSAFGGYVGIACLFAAQAIVYLLLLYGTNNFIITDTVLKNTVANIPHVDPELYLLNASSSKIAAYFFSPVVLGFKLFFITCMLYSGLMLGGRSISFPVVMKLMLTGELVFLGGSVFRFIGLLFFVTIDNLQDIGSYSQCSLAGIIPLGNDSPYRYALRAINLYELIFLFLVSYLLSKELNASWWVGLQYMMGTYGILLICWICLVSLLQQIS